MCSAGFIQVTQSVTVILTMLCVHRAAVHLPWPLIRFVFVQITSQNNGSINFTQTGVGLKDMLRETT